LRPALNDLQGLPKAVVQFPGHPFALLFLRFDQAAGKQLLRRARFLVLVDAKFVQPKHHPAQSCKRQPAKPPALPPGWHDHHAQDGPAVFQTPSLFPAVTRN